MDLGIAGRVALIAGGSKGMGRRAAELLAADEAAIAIVGLGEDKRDMDDAVAGIAAAGGKAIGIAADMTIKEQIRFAAETCRSKLGDPDIVIVNVNGPPAGAFDEVTDEQFEAAVLEMTLSGLHRSAW